LTYYGFIRFYARTLSKMNKW